MRKNKMLLGYILVIASAIIYGCIPLLTRYIYAEGLNSFSLVFIRNSLALPMLAIAARLGGSSLKITPRAIPSIGIIAAFGCCITPILLYTSYTDIDTGIATVFHFIYPALVMILGMVFLKNKLRPVNLVSLAVCIAGICMFYTPGAQIGVTGSSLALLSGLTYAIYIIGLSGFRHKEITGFVFNFYGSVFCSILSLIICICSNKLCFPTTLRSWLLCIFFALICNVGAVVLFQSGTRMIGGERASILSTFEPITSVIVGILFLHESGGVLSALGTVLVILAGALIAVADLKKSK